MALSNHYGQPRYPPDVKIWWAGFEQEAGRLQEAGWEFVIHDDHMYSPHGAAIKMLMKHPKTGAVLAGEGPPRYEAMDMTMGYRYHDRRPFVVRMRDGGMERQFILQLGTGGFNEIAGFHRYDLSYEARTVPLSRTEIFHKWADTTQEIVTDPETIDALFSKIKQLQEPELAKIRARNRTAETRRVVHAQIISLQDAA